MHAGVHPGVRHRRGQEPQPEAEPGCVPADGRGESESRGVITAEEFDREKAKILA